MSSSWTDLLAQIAPTIATALGGPVAGIAVKALSTTLLGHPNGSQDDISAAMASATPEQLLALKQADNDFKAKLVELGIQLDQLDVADRASARSLAETRGLLPQIGISAGFLLGYFGITGMLLAGYVKIPVDLKDVFEILLGVLTSAVPQILNFWLGSSHSSQKKDETISNLANS